MPRQQDGDSGKFTQVYDDEEFAAALDALGQAGTAEVAEVVGCGEKNAYRRLTALEDEGRVESRTVGNAKLWELTDGPNGIDPGDPFWNSTGIVSSGEGDLSETVDEELYGPAE
jgi:hypothetical protein